MMLTKAEMSGDVVCPECNNKFIVETTYEESRIECGGSIDCPNCHVRLTVYNHLSFSCFKNPYEIKK